MDYLSEIERDYRRLSEVIAGNLEAKVPTCPEWTVRDLADHVALVYLHKAACMRLNANPRPWPPESTGEPVEELLARAYAELSAEFAARPADSPAATWFEPDQSVSFWRRRMAHETFIHRIDGELAAGVPSLSIPPELALDGIDEILMIFLAWAYDQWPEDFVEGLSNGDGAVTLNTGAMRWTVRWDGDGVHPIEEREDPHADATIEGSPEAVLRWLWGRADDSTLAISGNPAKVAQLRQLLQAGTQ